MKKLILLSLLALTFSLSATPVDSSAAIKKARIFWSQTFGKDAEITWVQNNDFPNLYLFDINSNEGFVIVSADDAARSILAYSCEGGITKKPNADVRYWLDLYQQEIEWAKSAPKSTTQDSDTQDSPIDHVAPMLTSHWDQSPYYNKFCPQIEGEGRAVTGCGATAMAQVMRYHKHPAHGTGSHSYYHEHYGTISADFNVNYRWNLMPDKLDSETPGFKVDAVATLIYHCGVASDMDYSPAGSGAHAVEYFPGFVSSETALKYYFDYDSTTLRHIFRDDMASSSWDDSLRNELRLSHPIIYTGFDSQSGHAFVCDGFDSLGLFHFNWGWSGSYDGYFVTTALTPGPYLFTYGQQALLGIQPNAAPVSIESADSHPFDVYPLPARQYVTIAGQQINQIELYDISGRCHISNKGGDNNTLSLETLPAGLYILRIITNDGQSYRLTLPHL